MIYLFDEAKAMEMSFIKLYGRMCNGSGILSNLSLGGDGVLGLHGNLNGNFGRADKKRRGVMAFPLNGIGVMVFHSLTQAGEELGFTKRAIHNACNKVARRLTYKSIIFEYSENISEGWLLNLGGHGELLTFQNKRLPMQAFKKKSTERSMDFKTMDFASSCSTVRQFEAHSNHEEDYLL